MSTATTVGDPEAMRAFARQLISRADLLRTTQNGPAARLDGATFEGPAANRLRAAADALTNRLAGICSDIDATAQAVLADAAIVEQQNADLRAAAEREAEQKAQEQAGAPADPAPSQPAVAAPPAAPEASAAT